MKLIALTSILADVLKPPGSPLTVSDAEGVVLVRREFARHPTDDELVKHWPDEAQRLAAQEKAEADAKARAEAEAAAADKAQAEALAKADAEAKALAEADAKAKADAEAAPKVVAAKSTKAKAGGNG